VTNLYATLDDLKAETNRKQGRSDDAELMRILRRVSRAIDEEVGYPFWASLATHTYDGNGERRLWPQLSPTVGHVLTVTQLDIDRDDDGTYEILLSEGVDFRLWPLNRNNSPAWALEVLSRSTRISEWPRGQGSVRIQGVFGYSYDVEQVGTLGAAISSTTTTTITMADGHAVKVGHTLRIGDEQLYVSALTADTLTVQRGVNGTAAATHSNGAAVSARRYPGDIETACLLQSARMARELMTGGAGAGGEQFAIAFQSVYPAIRDALRHFKTWNLP
jgi:hypothetical protein